MGKLCIFTGHRTLPGDLLPLRQALRRKILQLAAEGFTRFASGGAAGFDLLAAELILYFALGLYSALEQTKKLKELLLLLCLYPMFHISYGIGSMCGITKLFSKEFKKDYVPKKLKTLIK